MKPTETMPGTYLNAPDADRSERPGVPMLEEPSVPVLRGDQLPAQHTEVEVLRGAGVPLMTPVFGTAQPPRGLSGVIRRGAYRIPEHRATRWMTLLLADRVDIWESRIRRHPLIAAAAVLGLVGVLGARRRRASRVKRRFAFAFVR